MKINELIFNELQEVDMNPTTNEYFMNEVYPILQMHENNVDEDEFDDLDYDKQEEIQETELVNVFRLSRYSFLFACMIDYFGSMTEAVNHMRSAFEDDDDIYFVTGSGYDIISSDLLGGEPDGVAEQKFLDALNK